MNDNTNKKHHYILLALICGATTLFLGLTSALILASDTGVLDYILIIYLYVLSLDLIIVTTYALTVFKYQNIRLFLYINYSLAALSLFFHFIGF